MRLAADRTRRRSWRISERGSEVVSGRSDRLRQSPEWKRILRRERLHRRNGETENERRRPTLTSQLKVSLLRSTSAAPFLLLVRFLRDLRAVGPVAEQKANHGNHRNERTARSRKSCFPGPSKRGPTTERRNHSFSRTFSRRDRLAGP